VIGRTGLYVARSVEVEFLTGRGNATSLSVQILTTQSVMEVTMRKRNVMTNVVQVCVCNCLLWNKLDKNILTEKPHWGDWEDWSVCSKKCGGGISYRKRKCVQSKCPYSDPSHNKCYGNDYEEKKCNDKCCPGNTLRLLVFVQL